MRGCVCNILPPHPNLLPQIQLKSVLSLIYPFGSLISGEKEQEKRNTETYGLDYDNFFRHLFRNFRNGQIMIVVKLGGGHGINYDAFCDDVAKVRSQGGTLVVVHGGSARLNEIATALNRPPRFITSPQGITSRWTDQEAMECFLMTYCGLVNKTLVELLQQRRVNAVGLSGMDGGIWTGPRKDVTQVVENGVRRVLRGNLTGRVDRVNVTLLRTLIEDGYLPVLTPPALSDDQRAINVDGDRAAARTAVEMQAESLLILTNQPGVLRDLSDPQSTLPELLLAADLSQEYDFIQGRMRIKLMAASEALRGGVPRVVIADGRQPNCIERGLAGCGTTIRLQNADGKSPQTP